MKKLLLFATFLLAGILTFAQSFPEVSISDIQYISEDSLLTAPHDYESPLEGDTVTITGVVSVAPYFYSDVDSGETLVVGAPALFLQDPDDPEFGGILCRFPGGSGAAFESIDTGMVVKLTGYIQEYFTTTQFNMIKFEADDVIDFSERPEPVQLTLEEFSEVGTSNPNYLSEKWEQVYVELRNVTVSTSYSYGSGTYVIFDENGTEMLVGNTGSYWRNQSLPQPGTKIDYIRGYIENRTNVDDYYYIINPVYPNDIKFGDVLPPEISNVQRDIGLVGFGDPVEISADVLDSDGTLTDVKVYYQANGSESQSVDMAQTAGNTFTAVLPSYNDSTLVSYYVKATDNDDNVTVSPRDTTEPYFYYVLEDAIVSSIQRVQRSPFGSGYSSYDGFELTVSGIVTSDTSTILSGAQVHIQNGTGPWSGIWIFGDNVLDLQVGDSVTVTGTVDEDYDYTRIESITEVIINSTGNPVPDPTEISTDVVGASSSGSLPAESYEGVLVVYSDVTVIDENADGDPGPDEGSGGSRNFGEMLIADNSNVGTRVELQQGNNDYHNFWDASLENEPIRLSTGNTLDQIIGIQYFSFGEYKLVPRTNDDFVGLSTAVDEEPLTADQFQLAQNYPNPFNPTTVIQFSIPKRTNVSLKIYDVLGQEVVNLVNQEMNRGVHRVNFDGAQLSSGIYFYQLQAGNFIQTKKMLLIK